MKKIGKLYNKIKYLHKRGNIFPFKIDCLHVIIHEMLFYSRFLSTCLHLYLFHQEMLFFLPLKNTKTMFLFTISVLVLNYVVFLISEFIIIPYQNIKKINTIYSKNPFML